MAKNSYHHGDLRQTIIEEALSWLEQENVVNLSLRGIAKRIGVSHNAPYRHFPDKESLLIEIAQTGFEGLYQASEKSLLANPKDAQKRLEAIGVAYIQYAVDHKAYYQVMFSDCLKNYRQDPSLDRSFSKAFQVLLDVIKAGQEAQVFVLQDPYQLALVCWSLVHGVSMLAIDGGLIPSDDESIFKLAQIATRTMSKGLIKDISKADS